ncbi:MAG: molybdopterin-dependent oxidoreductase [Acidimicrobiia bacterium]|nr:molybdopterin-dependent oxidoreductase [Acidimicrobiia bacterium]
MTVSSTADPAGPEPTSPWRAFVSGLLAVGLALGVAELIVGASGASRSLVTSIGDWVIEVSPSGLVKWAIELFGTKDKLVLVLSIVVVCLAVGGLVGVAARRSPWLPPIVFVGFAAAAIVLAFQDPLANRAASFAAAVAAAGVGLAALAIMLRTEAIGSNDDRRLFLKTAGAAAVLGVAAAAVGRSMIDRMAVIADRAEITLPFARSADPALPAGAQASGAVPVITPNGEFYKIDTSLATPSVDLTTWRLKITGLVDRELEFSYNDLLDMEMDERIVTLSCVSNRVGGSLVGTANWLGIPLAELLDKAGVKPEASQIVGRSVDGFTVGFPTAAAYDGRDAMIAIGMNGEPLPLDHGFPARIVVAGLYGYVSATKWLSEIELTTWDAFDAYWIPRGWAKEGPIKTQSRIDTPRDGRSIAVGENTIAGVAWAPNRGITRVEIQIDGGAWQETTLAESIGDDGWRQWQLDWTADPGAHEIVVRATDGTGATQTAGLAAPRPDGATGHHTITVNAG